MVQLFGGENEFEAAVDELFAAEERVDGEMADITGMIGQYVQGNEPSHHMAYLYNYVGAPWKTQYWTRRILKELYQPTPDGLSGNEDCGQMSAWYILSSLGIYPSVRFKPVPPYNSLFEGRNRAGKREASNHHGQRSGEEHIYQQGDPKRTSLKITTLPIPS